MRLLGKKVVRLAKGDSPVSRLVDRTLWALRRASVGVCSDRRFVEMYGRYRGVPVDLSREPRTFNEKIAWLKVNWRDPRLHRIVDKWAVRQFVAERVGEGVLIPVHAKYERAADISSAQLPKSFVLKPTHGSGWVVLVRDVAQFDEVAAKRRLKRWMQRDYYYHAREWAYRGVPRAIICEQALFDEAGRAPLDYKIFCFGGVPRFVQVDIDRFGEHRRSLFSPDWQPLDAELLYPRSAHALPRPPRLTEMLGMAAELSRGFPFLRVDLYEINGKVFFGELTLFPENGAGEIRPSSADLDWGGWIDLSSLRG